jgi:hypothetical protein
MTWKPGQSGNPGGRPPVVKDIRELARKHTREAVEALVGVVRNKKAPPAAIVAAANSLLDRGYGRAASSDLEGGESLVIRIIKFADAIQGAGDVKVIEHDG